MATETSKLTSKAMPLDLEFVEALQDTLSEWTTQEDEDAYRDFEVRPNDGLR